MNYSTKIFLYRVVCFIIGFLFVTLIFWVGGNNFNERNVHMVFWLLFSTLGATFLAAVGPELRS